MNQLKNDVICSGLLTERLSCTYLKTVEVNSDGVYKRRPRLLALALTLQFDHAQLNLFGFSIVFRIYVYLV